MRDLWHRVLERHPTDRSLAESTQHGAGLAVRQAVQNAREQEGSWSHTAAPRVSVLCPGTSPRFGDLGTGSSLWEGQSQKPGCVSGFHDKNL